jgi:hypothetical protein
MSQVDYLAPMVFEKNAVLKGEFQYTTRPNLPSCNLMGGGTFSWLLQFDAAAGTLKTGGARWVADPTLGYAFDDEMITQGPKVFHVQPVTFMAKPDATGAFMITTPQNIILPVFLDPGGSNVLLLPIQQFRVTMGTLAASQNCIGHYNAEGLDPNNNCLPDSTTPEFITGGQVDGLIDLEDADGVVLAALNQTLCVLLSGDAQTYGTSQGGTTVCKRDASAKILFQGDACSSGGTCNDSVQLKANFAASSVLVTN